MPLLENCHVEKVGSRIRSCSGRTGQGPGALARLDYQQFPMGNGGSTGSPVRVGQSPLATPTHRLAPRPSQWSNPQLFGVAGVGAEVLLPVLSTVSGSSQLLPEGTLAAGAAEPFGTHQGFGHQSGATQVLLPIGWQACEHQSRNRRGQIGPLTESSKRHQARVLSDHNSFPGFLPSFTGRAAQHQKILLGRTKS